MEARRTYWICHNLPSGEQDYLDVSDEDRERADWLEANLASSLLEDGQHAPAIDIDFKAALNEGVLEVSVADENFIPALAEEGVNELIESGLVSEASVAEASADAWKVELQIPYSAQLLPSRTPEHYHLYIEQAVDWESYRQLLGGLMYLGVVEEGFYDAGVQREMTFLRKAQMIGQQALRLNDHKPHAH